MLAIKEGTLEVDIQVDGCLIYLEGKDLIVLEKGRAEVACISGMQHATIHRDGDIIVLTAAYEEELC